MDKKDFEIQSLQVRIHILQKKVTELTEEIRKKDMDIRVMESKLNNLEDKGWEWTGYGFRKVPKEV
jgi:peptidoglycan hydrolase CwlO-like protein